MDQFNHGSAVDAVVRAGRSGDPGSNVFGGTSDRKFASGQPRHIDPQFGALLSRILAGTGTAAIPCLQFVACGARNRATAIAFQTSQAASSVLGRTLLVNARLDRDGPPIHGEVARAPVPDAFIPGLYHHEIASRPADIALLFGAGRKTAFQTLVSPYHFVAIDCPPPSDGPSANAFAALCLGSILVVTAGSSTRDAIKDALLNVTQSGGKIIGTVLAEAPPDIPAWMSRR